MGAPGLSMSQSGRSTGKAASEHEDDFAPAEQDPITKLAFAVQALNEKVDRGFQDVSNRFSTYKVRRSHTVRSFDQALLGGWVLHEHGQCVRKHCS